MTKQIKNYEGKEREGLLLWCIGMLMDDMSDITKAFVNRKPLAQLSKKEFIIENADMALGIVMGQLEEMGISPEKLMREARGKEHLHEKAEDIPDLVLVEDE